LENIVKSCDRKIEKQKHRTDQDMIVSEDEVLRIFKIHKDISQCLSQCEMCGADGDIDQVFDLMQQVSDLHDASSRLENPPDEKRNIVCETSGNYMSSR
jgi:hypothetical protein